MQKNLNLFADIFDQWKEWQRNWLYLENIFLSEDIRTQTRNDYQEFEKVNKKVVGLMTNVNKNNKVKQHWVNKTLQDLQSSNQTMDEIQKHLETFLENKRKDFPRFFFLSNDELLQILAAAQDIRKVEKHLNKIFENIMKIKLGEDLNSNQIYAIISAEGEVVMYSSPIKIRTDENVEFTLKEIEAKMFETLKKRLFRFYDGYDLTNIDKSNWVFSEVGQIVAAFSQVIWTELSEYYINEMEKENYTSLNGFLELLCAQLLQMTELIRGKLEPVERK